MMSILLGDPGSCWIGILIVLADNSLSTFQAFACRKDILAALLDLSLLYGQKRTKYCVLSYSNLCIRAVRSCSANAKETV